MEELILELGYNIALSLLDRFVDWITSGDGTITGVTISDTNLYRIVKTNLDYNYVPELDGSVDDFVQRIYDTIDDINDNPEHNINQDGIYTTDTELAIIEATSHLSDVNTQTAISNSVVVPFAVLCFVLSVLNFFKSKFSSEVK